MNRNCVVIAMLAGAGLAYAKEEWRDPAVNSVNRLPARTYSMPLADEKAALTDALEPDTPYKLSLNGDWKYSWAGCPDLRVKDFWKADFDDSAWFTIDVPSCVELRGFGVPHYTNSTYPHADKSNPTRDGKDFAEILDRDRGTPDYNPVSSYRRTFTVPEAWQGREVILRFDGVYSAYYVWINGKLAGYAEDSKLPSEFNITSLLDPRPAALNLICVEVYRWCDGSYLEDQDMTRYSGIFRDVTLWAKPKDGLWDFNVKTRRDGEDGWKLDVEVEKGVTGTLYDADFKEVGKLSRVSNNPSVPNAPSKLRLLIHPRLWSAEDPYLYTLVLRKGDDIRMKRVGFKDQRIDGCVFKVNGQPIKFRGVNRHETSPDNGRSVTMEEMLRDIFLMKQYNIDTVRTCHYPDDHRWYDLCDRYGIYLVAEANVEAHEPGYGDRGLGRFPEWEHTIVERNERHVVFYRNNPSVTMWSMGNETGHGDNFRKALARVKELDSSRPRHWERGNPDADVDSRMYPTVEWMDERGKMGDGDPSVTDTADKYERDENRQTPNKCFFVCEYAHAMGNALGNFQEYWETFYAHPSLCAGCIWDWVDQAVWKYTGELDPKTGKAERFLSYGGDFDEEPHLGPFNCNGVIDPLRRVSAKLVEVGHVQRQLVVTRSQAKGDSPFAVVFELWNRFLFTRADKYAANWSLLENGTVKDSGAFEVPALEPLKRCRFMVPGLAEALAKTAAGAELFVNFEFTLKEDAPWAKKGWVIARDQVKISEEAENPTAGKVEKATPMFTEDGKTLAVQIGATTAVFCRRSGTLCELEMNGRTVLKDPAPGVITGPQFSCMRAFVDNDRWLRDGNPWSEDRKGGSFFSLGLTQLRRHARPIIIRDDRVCITTEVTGEKSAGFTEEAVWSFAADGSIEVDYTITPHGTMPVALPRLGVSMKLDSSLEQVSYYGRGPRENYIDRRTASFFGIWNTTVTDLYEPYVRPQDNGSRGEVRWATFTDKSGRGVKFSASEPLYLQAQHHSCEDLEFSRHRAGQKRFRAPLVERPEVYLNLDVRQLGLGGASCGPKPMAKYIFPVEKTSWSLRLTPVRNNE